MDVSEELEAAAIEIVKILEASTRECFVCGAMLMLDEAHESSCALQRLRKALLASQKEQP